MKFKNPNKDNRLNELIDVLTKNNILTKSDSDKVKNARTN